MPSLFIIAHGSRRAAPNDEVRAQPDQAYDHVEAAFLELAEPGIADRLARWRKKARPRSSPSPT